MYFIKSIIDIILVLLLLRLLIKPNEAFFDPIYGLIYRITDPLLIPSRYITRKPTHGIVLTLLALVVLRGAVYLSITPMTLMAGIGLSLLSLLQLLFQAYIVIWFVSFLSKRGFGMFFLHIVERAFAPFNAIFKRFGIPGRNFHVSFFLMLWILYALLSIVIRSVMIPQSTTSPLSVVHGFGEGLILVLALFPFPGFFSLVIIIGALLSWVSPDPSNPVVQAIYGVSEPLLDPFRRFVPLLGGLDLSPIVALLCFQILGGIGQQVIKSFLDFI